MDSNGGHGCLAVIVRTDHLSGDATSLTQIWADDVLQGAKDVGIPCTEFYVTWKGTGCAAQTYLSGRIDCPDLFVFYGHGLEDALLMPGGDLDCSGILIGTQNLDALRNKQVCATACCSAAVLGARAIQQGPVCYVGYSRVFYLYHDDADFRECANAWIEPLLAEGANWAVAVDRMRHRYRQRIQFCHTDHGMAKYQSDAWVVAGYLQHNLDALVQLGNGNATFVPPTSP